MYRAVYIQFALIKQIEIYTLCVPSMGRLSQDSQNIPESGSLSQAIWQCLLVSRKVANREVRTEARLTRRAGKRDYKIRYAWIGLRQQIVVH